MLLSTYFLSDRKKFNKNKLKSGLNLCKNFFFLICHPVLVDCWINKSTQKGSIKIKKTVPLGKLEASRQNL